MTFVVGLVIGGVGGRLMAGRGSSAAPDRALEPRQLKPEPEGLAVGAPDASVEGSEALAAEVDNVVAELERRYQGRRADGQADTSAQGHDV